VTLPSASLLFPRLSEFHASTYPVPDIGSDGRDLIINWANEFAVDSREVEDHS
jgi:hypothetical protein